MTHPGSEALITKALMLIQLVKGQTGVLHAADGSAIKAKSLLFSIQISSASCAWLPAQWHLHDILYNFNRSNHISNVSYTDTMNVFILTEIYFSIYTFLLLLDHWIMSIHFVQIVGVHQQICIVFKLCLCFVLWLACHRAINFQKQCDGIFGVEIH